MHSQLTALSQHIIWHFGVWWKIQVRYIHVLTFKVNKTLGWCVVLVIHWVALFPEISKGFFFVILRRKDFEVLPPSIFLTTNRVLEFMRVIYILESCISTNEKNLKRQFQPYQIHNIDLRVYRNKATIEHLSVKMKSARHRWHMYIHVFIVFTIQNRLLRSNKWRLMHQKTIYIRQRNSTLQLF